MRFVATLALLLSGTQVWAAETVLTGSEIAAALNNLSLYADGEIEQIFQSGGQTVYIQKGSVSQGLWKVEADKYCSQWPPSQTWACYDVIRDDEVITFISSGGKRFPMNVKRPVQAGD